MGWLERVSRVVRGLLLHELNYSDDPEPIKARNVNYLVTKKLLQLGMNGRSWLWLKAVKV